MPRGRYYQQEEERSRTIDARAPMATPPSGLTGGAPRVDDLTWANQFQRRDTKFASLEQLPGPATAAPVAQPQTITSQVLSEITSRVGAAPISLDANPGKFTAFLPTTQRTPAPPLTQLAAGGVTHRQDWMANAANGRQAIRQYTDRSRPAYTTYSRPLALNPPELQRDSLTSSRGLRWASAFH